MIVVAAEAARAEVLRGRLHELGASVASALHPMAARTLLLAATDDPWADERIAAELRAGGEIALVRPDGGARLAAWMAHTRPIEFGERLSVCFAWSEHDRATLANVVELGLGGFGNGEHPTTRLLVEELMARLRGGERVLDVGCGSGVLGLAALRLGAGTITALDIKPEAVAAARRNAALNGMSDRFEATAQPLGEIAGPYEVVLANIGRGAIAELAEHLVRCLAPVGWLAVSGFSPSQSEQVAAVLRPLAELGRLTSGDWSALVFALGGVIPAARPTR